jgi:pimeloyl-ACP methyl ester carboxylesterase
MMDEARCSVAQADLVVGASLGGWLALHVLCAARPGTPLLLLAPALSIHALDAERPWLARLWRRVGVPVRDKASRRVRWVSGRLLDELVAAGPPPVPCARVVIVHGRRDLTVPIEASRRFASGHPGVVLHEVEDGHALARSLARVVASAEDLLALR